MKTRLHKNFGSLAIIFLVSMVCFGSSQTTNAESPSSSSTPTPSRANKPLVSQSPVTSSPCPAPGADACADIGDPYDEPYHNLVGWGSSEIGGPVIPPSGDPSKRFQLLRGDNSLNLFLPQANISYTLYTEVEDGGCDDSWQIYINGQGPIFTYYHNPSAQGGIPHSIDVSPNLVPTNILTLTYRNIASDYCGLAAVFNAKMIPVGGTYSISGQVTDGSNRAISGVSVSSSSGTSAVTDVNGNYTISNLTPGSYTITPTMSGYTFSPNSFTVNVPPNSRANFIGIAQRQLGSVPFFSQRDPNWITSPLGTNGGCSTNCSTIGACGCALTSATMVFAYYGANLIPPTLSSCMGNLACPFYWITGASCTNGKANWVSQYQFAWNRVDYELNQNKRPVILGMHRKGNPDNTHWVVIVSGSGSDPGNYAINDPWFLDGANISLSARSPKYDFDWLSVYSGQATRSNEPIVKLSPSTPKATLSTSTVVSGNASILRITPITMTVAVVAQSSAGNVTDMLIWTDTMSNTTWQPFQTLISLPVSDNVYAEFRDQFGNLSNVSSDSTFPLNTPTNPPLQIFFPFIRR